MKTEKVAAPAMIKNPDIICAISGSTESGDDYLWCFKEKSVDAIVEQVSSQMGEELGYLTNYSICMLVENSDLKSQIEEALSKKIEQAENALESDDEDEDEEY